MSKQTTREQAYFHINNGGITFAIIERLDTRKAKVFPAPKPGEMSPEISDAAYDSLPLETHYNRSWRFKVSTNHFGTGTSFSFPLVPFMVRWTIGALERVLVSMETHTDKPTDGYEHALRDLTYCAVGARDGQRVDEYWPEAPKRSTATSSVKQ